MYAKVANQLLQGKKVTIEYTTINKLLDKPAEKSDVKKATRIAVNKF